MAKDSNGAFSMRFTHIFFTIWASSRDRIFPNHYSQSSVHNLRLAWLLRIVSRWPWLLRVDYHQKWQRKLDLKWHTLPSNILFDQTLILDPNPLWTWLSQLSMVKIVKFQCPLESQWPEHSKTPPIFNPSVILKGVIANQTWAASFALVHCM